MWLNVQSDDDPPQFAKLGEQLSLELVADLGSQLGPAEADDQAADRGEHRDQANGQGQQGGRKMRCREGSEASSMIHRVRPFRKSDRFSPFSHFTKKDASLSIAPN